jgi:hypothetical protein
MVGVSDRDGLTRVEVFVLAAVEPEAMLWELPAVWTDNGTDAQRAAVIPPLRDAVVSLAGRGLIEVLDFPAWPSRRDQAIPVTAGTLPAVLAADEVWLWRDQDTSLLTVSITAAGVAWLSHRSWR